MTKEETIINLFKDVGLIAIPMKSRNKITSWQLEGFTNRGGDMIHTLDFSGLDALNVLDVFEVFSNYIDDIDIDDEIELSLEAAKAYGLTTRDFVHDYEDYFEDLKRKQFNLAKLIIKLKNQ